MQNIGFSILCFFVAYTLVTWVGIIHTIFNIKVLHMKSMKESPGMGECYEKTKPWHPLYNIIIFPIFGLVYMKGLTNPSLNEALITCAFWAGIAIVGDLVGWVLIKHPWRLTFKEFYVDYQPWITLIYIAIFLGPIIGFILL
ncbi:MAG: hypothetical protein K6E99_05220 [Bacilli bacterium]|nr:hypothetical protein [Bacilli bacterium]